MLLLASVCRPVKFLQREEARLSFLSSDMSENKTETPCCERKTYQDNKKTVDITSAVFFYTCMENKKGHRYFFTYKKNTLVPCLLWNYFFWKR